LGRIGYYWGKSGKKWDQLGEIYADFNYTRSANGTGGSYSYVGIYGWTWDPMMEWYIIDDWYGNGQLGMNTLGNNCQAVGSPITVDGGTYNVYTCTRPQGSGSIDDSKPAFPQIFSIRQDMTNQGGPRQCGTYSITEHFREWAKIDALKSKIGKNTYEAKFLVEAGSGTGWFEATYLKLTQEDAPRDIPANHFVVVTEASPFNGGTINKEPALLYYQNGASVQLTAVPTEGWKFDGWEGDASGTAATATITVDAQKRVKAKFSLRPDNNINLVRDGNFPGTSLTSNWSLNIGQYYGNSQASASVSGGKATINISNANTNVWEPQLTQYDIELVEGQKYKLTFTAQAVAARDMQVSVQKTVEPWTDYARDTFNLTTSPQDFELEFTMSTTDPASQLSFNLGGQSGNMPSVTISDVKLGYVVSPDAVYDKDIPQANVKKSSLKVTAKKSAVNVKFKAKGNGTAELRLYGLKGNLVTKANLQTTAGKSYSHTFNAGKLPNGFYVVSVHSNGSVERSKVIMPK
jgi:hypothetical protein